MSRNLAKGDDLFSGAEQAKRLWAFSRSFAENPSRHQKTLISVSQKKGSRKDSQEEEGRIFQEKEPPGVKKKNRGGL